jgi:hypothetical protein
MPFDHRSIDIDLSKRSSLAGVEPAEFGMEAVDLLFEIAELFADESVHAAVAFVFVEEHRPETKAHGEFIEPVGRRESAKSPGRGITFGVDDANVLAIEHQFGFSVLTPHEFTVNPGPSIGFYRRGTEKLQIFEKRRDNSVAQFRERTLQFETSGPGMAAAAELLGEFGDIDAPLAAETDADDFVGRALSEQD